MTLDLPWNDPLEPCLVSTLIPRVAFSILFSGTYHMAHGILVPWTGMEPHSLQWNFRVLNTELPGKSHAFSILALSLLIFQWKVLVSEEYQVPSDTDQITTNTVQIQ